MIKGEINLDHDRTRRLGFAEAVYSESKNVDQLTEILNQAGLRQINLLLTRLSVAHFESLPEKYRTSLDYDPVSQTAFFGQLRPPSKGTEIAVVTAGTSDVPVALEAARTLRFYGHDVLTINDVGVAGLWRLLDRLESLNQMSVVIAVAGMDGALPSVVAGLVSGCVIAVPTSVGYGVANRGQTALHAALASCAPGLVVVNIDNGYGAACAAIRIVQRKCPRSELPDPRDRFHRGNGAEHTNKTGKAPL
jgi:pyridinium-3,5-biscarboxylic acid mononucleotide synthase